MNWATFSIDQVCEKVTDGAHSSPPDYKGGFPMASSKDMEDNDFNLSRVRYIHENDYAKLVKGDCKPLVGDVLVIKDGNSYLKHIFCVKEERDLVILSSIAMLRPNQKIIDPFFFQHILRSPETKKNMENYVSGAAIPRIVLKDFKGMKLSIPPLPIQKKIASILSAYDDLIENNLKRIKLLEEAAQNIYKEWFVNFRFPGYEGATFAEDGLPEGWKKKKLVDVAENIARGISPKYVSSNGIRIVNQRCIRNHLIDYSLCRLSDRSKKVPADKFLEQFDVLINSTGTGTLGRVAQVLVSSQEVSLDTHVTLVRANNRVLPLVLGRSLENQEALIASLGKGATNQIELSRKDLGSLVYIDIPPLSLQSEYESIVKPMYELISKLIANNAALKEARDILLPRLMNRIIEV